MLKGTMTAAVPKDLEKAKELAKKVEQAEEKVAEIMNLRNELLVNYVTKLMQN